MLRLFVVLTLFGTAYTHAQEDSASLGSIVLSDAKTVWIDAGRIFSAPARFQSGDWIETGGIAGGTAVLFSVDESARSLALRNQSQFGDRFFDVGRQYGGFVYPGIIMGGLYIGGLAFRNTDVRLTGVYVFESVAFAGAITSVLKSAFGRSRPYLEEGNTTFRSMEFKTDNTSLPSGHATIAFAISSCLSGRIKNTWASVGLYSLAALTAASRVYHDEHWFSDTFLGAAIGTAVGMSVAHLHDEDRRGSSLRIFPTIQGLRAELTF